MRFQDQKEKPALSGGVATARYADIFTQSTTYCLTDGDTLQKEHSANFLPSAAPPSKSKSKSTAPIPYTSSSSGQFSPFIALDCRGLEFTEFHFAGKWKAEGEESGAAFEFDWDELRKEQGGEERWDDYDEDAGVAVAVSELNSKIERAQIMYMHFEGDGNNEEKKGREKVFTKKNN